MESKPFSTNKRYLTSDWRKCPDCEVTIKTPQIRCPCCNQRMRTRRRKNENKVRL